MIMSIQEIAKSYNEAKNKSSQIGVLADLNDCSKEQIIVVLKGQGITDIPQPSSKEKKPKVIKTITEPKKIEYKDELETDEKLNALFTEGLAALESRIAYYERKLAKARAQKEKLLQIKEMEE